jgi:hypothetical protein
MTAAKTPQHAGAATPEDWLTRGAAFRWKRRDFAVASEPFTLSKDGPELIALRAEDGTFTAAPIAALVRARFAEQLIPKNAPRN